MKPAIVVDSLTKTFRARGKTVYALNSASFTVYTGEIFALLGPNGAGKTTLINILLNLVTPQSGSAQMLGKRIGEPSVLKRINYIPSEAQYHWKLTPKDILLSFAYIYEVKNPEKAVGRLEKSFDLEKLRNKKWWMLSTGEQAKVKLAKALINSPKLLLLDEPTLGLDPRAAASVRRALKRINRRGVTIFFTSHNMAEVAELADRVAFIKDGRILDISKVSKIIKKYGSLEKYWLRLGK